MQIKITRSIHPQFLYLLEHKDKKIIDLFKDLREYVLEIYPDSNELLYHTHALSTGFTLTEKLADTFCVINIYAKHMNLGFPKGSLLKDPYALLTGTGKLIRHIPIHEVNDYRNKMVKDLIKASLELAKVDLEKPSKIKSTSISKIKK